MSNGSWVGPNAGGEAEIYAEQAAASAVEAGTQAGNAAQQVTFAAEKVDQAQAWAISETEPSPGFKSAKGYALEALAVVGVVEAAGEAAITETGQNRAAAASAAVSASASSSQAEQFAGQAAAAANARASINVANTDTRLALGDTFTAPLPDGSLQAYTKTSTTANNVAAPFGVPFATQAALNAVTNLIKSVPDTTTYHRWRGPGGFHLARLGADGLATSLFSVGATGFRGASVEISQDMIKFSGSETRKTTGPLVITRDKAGFWIDVKGAAAAVTPPSVDADLVARNAAALAASRVLQDSINTEIQSAVFDYNVVVTYGQSFSTAYEGWPALSVNILAEQGLLMYGDSVRPNARDGTVFVPVGSAVLKPLKATTQSTAAGNPVMTDAEVAALPTNASNDGESPDVGAAIMWRKMFLQFHGLRKDDSRKFVFVNCGVGGKTIEELSKGATPNRYGRVTDALTKLKTLVDAENLTNGTSKTIGVVATLHMQGQYNYSATWGGTTDRAAFLNLTRALRNDLHADYKTIFGAAQGIPAFITDQTGGSYTNDATNLSIGMAQLDMGNDDNCFVASPTYPFTDKNGHLDPNGYRWVGMMLGKVLHRVVDRRQRWKNLQPRRVTVSGKLVRADFLVWSPPLQWRTAYQVLSPYFVNSRGFRITDSIGDVGFTPVIAADAVVDFVLDRATSGPVYLWAGDKTIHNGNCNLTDSDQTVAAESYSYTAGSGQFPAANIAALVNKPYPLNNPCAAFCVLAEAI